MPTTTAQFKSLWAQYADASKNTPVKLYLLAPSVTSISSDVNTPATLPGKLPTAGGYNVAGINAGDWPMKTDDSSVMELSLPSGSATWTATGTFTVTFRWLAIVANGVLLSVIDYGTGISLTNAPISITVAESPYLDDSFPVYRWRVQ